MPPRPQRELRDLVRYRKAKIQERGQEVQRVEKTLQDAGIKLSSVASELLGKSARLMLDALSAAPTTPRSSPRLGEVFFYRRDTEHTERYRRRLIHQLERLGHKVTLQPLPDTA